MFFLCSLTPEQLHKTGLDKRPHCSCFSYCMLCLACAFPPFHFTVLQITLKSSDQHALYTMFNSDWTFVPYQGPINCQPSCRDFPCVPQTIYPGPARGYHEVSALKSVKQFASVRYVILNFPLWSNSLVYRWQNDSFTPSLNPTSSTVGFDNEYKIIFTGGFTFQFGFQCTNYLPFPPILLLPLLLLDLL